jgi:hypothetical protein
MDSEQYFSFSGRRVKFDELVENIRDLFGRRGDCEIIIKINGDVISADDQKRFLGTFGEIADGVFIEHVMSCWPQFDLEIRGVPAHKKLGVYGQPIKEVICCPYIFYSFSINSDGTASACFLDWERKLVIGDAKKQSIKEIWAGVQLRAHQLMMLRGERKGHPICGNCGQMSHGMPDNIDPYREMLLGNLGPL